MNRGLSIFLILLFLISLGLVPSSRSQSSSFSVSAQWLTSPPYVAPGEKLVQLQVTLVYNGVGNITNAKIYPVKNYYIETSPFIVNSNTQTYNLPVIIPNQQYSFTFIGNITPNIPLGVYYFYLKIEYSENGVKKTQTVSVQIPILGYVQLSATAQTNGVIFPGEQYVPINLVIYNTGTVTAKNVTLLLNSVYPLKFITKEVSIPIIPAGSSASVQVVASVYDNATIGAYNIPFTALVFGSYHSLYMTIVVNSNKSIGGKLLTPYLTLDVGPYQLGVPINLRLIYTGPVTVDSYSIQLYLPKGFSNSSGGNIIQVNGGALQPDQEFVVPFTINIYNVSLGGYTIPLKVIWNAVEGNGVSVNVVQYMTFTLFLKGQPNIKITPKTSILYMGKVNNITLLISNTGSGSLYNLSISISSQLAILNNLPEIKTLLPNQSVEVPLEVYVPSNYQGMPVQLTLTISYLNSVYQQSQYSQQIGFYVSPLLSPNLPIVATLNPGILNPAMFVPANLILSNTLNITLYNISISLSSPVYINVTAISLPSLKPNSKYIIPITVNAQSSGSYEISLSIVYYQDNIQRQEQVTVPLYVMQVNTPTIPILVKFNSTLLTTGQIEDVTIMVQNLLNQQLNNVTISLTSQGILYLNTTTIILSSLSPLQKLLIPAKVYTQSAGVVSVIATVSYYQAGQLKQTQETIYMLASGSVKIALTSISYSPSTAVSGGLVSVTGIIYNFGTGPASGLVVTVIPPKGFVVIGQNTYYVGRLDPSTSSTFTFAFKILNSTKPGSYTIPLEYTYTNNIGQVLHSYSNITLEVVSNSSSTFSKSNTQSNSGSIFLYVGIGIIVIVLVIILVKMLRKGGST